MRIAAVIPNWNGAHLLRRLLPTLHAQTRKMDSIIVVDNGSSDDSIQTAEQLGARVIRFEANRGFAPAVNAGVAATDADVIAILNNDTELQANWLEACASALTDESVAFVTGKILDSSHPELLDGTFDAVCRGGCALRCGAGRPDSSYWNNRRRIQFAPFTAVLVRRQVFRDLGGLDETFESYMEDVEFGLRCASNGYTGIYEPSAVAQHLGSATLGAWSPRTVRYIARNQVLLVARHYDQTALLRFGWSIAVAQLLWGIIAARRGAATAWMMGKLEGVRLFRSCRGGGSPHALDILQASERLIRDVQQQTGFQLYWRLYFLLTSRVPGD
jgi:GT2 family glycosyltransferase